MRFLCVIVLFLWAGMASASASTDAVPKKTVILRADTSGTVNVRHFDANALKNYTRDKDFRYEQAKDLSWWETFWQWIWDWLAGLFKFKKVPGNWILTILSILWRIIELIVLVGGVAALIYFLLKAGGVDVRSIFRRDSAAIVPYSESDENINTINFDAEIEKAAAAHNYRLAVRLLYLRCLKQLSDAGAIEWKIDKTNYAYISELKNDTQRSAFSSLTRRFEYIWYGEFAIDARSYNDISLAFNQFNQQGS
ncbi:MAG: DUF4129 domain-containing protein [Bacteroidetes bacterium]|nr:DUF4129 domain-containing protein [Bacteroidota bacterium]